MKFLIDNQLPVALSRFLQSKHIDSVHVVDINLDEASDKLIWQYAKQHGYTIVSKDEDFFNLAMQDSTVNLLWVRLGNCRKNHLLSAFDKALPMVITQFNQGQKIIEIR